VRWGQGHDGGEWTDAWEAVLIKIEIDAEVYDALKRLAREGFDP
jgi:hypothetical protein